MGKKDIRNNFRNSVFKRDNHKCKFCDCKTDLDAHHITDRHEIPNGGYVLENGITLCPVHHMMAEKYHITGGKEWSENMHPDDLYVKIKSSKELAILQSNNLQSY